MLPYNLQETTRVQAIKSRNNIYNDMGLKSITEYVKRSQIMCFFFVILIVFSKKGYSL
jgi:hypothetical protein